MLEPAKRWLIAGASLAAVACQDPPPKHVDRVPPPAAAVDREEAEAFKKQAHEEALEDALPKVLAALMAGDPLAAYRAGRGPAAIPPLTVGSRLAVAEQLRAAQAAVVDIDEGYLSPAGVVVLRVVRFGITMLNDELERRPRLRQDPVAALRSVAAILDELRYRVVHDDCDAACEALPAELAAALPGARQQLAAASIAATEQAKAEALKLAARSRELAGRVGDRPALAANLEQLAVALDEDHAWLETLAEALPRATDTHVWTAKPAPIRPGGVAVVERLPDVIGPHALIRRLSVEERIDLDPDRALAQVQAHVRRWDALRRELVGDEVPEDRPAPVDLARCEAALARITAGLAGVAEVEAPTLACDRFVALLGERELGEGALILAVLDDGVIEPQRRKLRAAELAELALVSGQWSPTVHRHLRRIMLLAQIGEPAARARALDEGQRALCLTAAALWIHGELGPTSEIAATIGPSCAMLGDEQAITRLVTGDPRGALAGFGLSLIGDEPARMVGFDRFYWAPLGLMQILATPKGMHPDEFTLPDDRRPGPDPHLDVKYEEL